MPARIILLLCVLFTACSKPQQHQHTVFVFGTLLDITLYDVDEERARHLFDELEAVFHRQHADWTPWQYSDLSTVNAAIAADETIDVPVSTQPLIEISRSFYDSSDGLFDPAIGQLIKMWQFHRHDDPELRPPAPDDIDAYLSDRPTLSDLNLENGQLDSDNPAVDLNFGAIAKGYAIDIAMDWLEAEGIDHAIINAGGDLSVMGTRGDRDWSIGIRHPRQAGLIASIDARSGESIFTSGDYERYYIYSDRRYHHILDPRTGYPADEAASVTVIAEDPSLADAAATALFVAGSDDWHRIAGKMGIEQVLLIDTEGRLHMTRSMADRLNILVSPVPPIIFGEAL